MAMKEYSTYSPESAYFTAPTRQGCQKVWLTYWTTTFNKQVGTHR